MNPLSWALRALVTNELNTPKWDIPSGVPGLTMGQAAADQFSFKLGAKWIWGSVGYSWGCLLLFTAAGALALSWTNPPSPQPTGARRGRGGVACRRRRALAAGVC